MLLNKCIFVLIDGAKSSFVKSSNSLFTTLIFMFSSKHNITSFALVVAGTDGSIRLIWVICCWICFELRKSRRQTDAVPCPHPQSYISISLEKMDEISGRHAKASSSFALCILPKLLKYILRCISSSRISVPRFRSLYSLSKTNLSKGNNDKAVSLIPMKEISPLFLNCAVKSDIISIYQ